MNHAELDTDKNPDIANDSSQVADDKSVTDGRAGPSASNDQIDLVELAQFLWSKKNKIIACALVIAGLAFAYFGTRAPAFVSESKLILSLEASDRGTLSKLGLSAEVEPADVAKHLAQYFNNRDVVTKAISSAIGSEHVDIWEAVEVGTPRDQAVISVTASWDDAEISAKLAKEVVSQGIEGVDELIAGRIDEKFEKAKARAASASEQWKNASDSYSQLIEKHQVDTKKQKLQILIAQRGNDKAELPRLMRDKKRIELVLESVSANLAKEVQKIELKRSLAEDPQLTASLLSMSGKPLDADAMAGLALTVEEENPIYLDLKRRMISGMVQLEETKSKISEIEKVLKKNDELVQKLQKEIESGNYVISQARQLRDLAKREHDAAKSEEWNLLSQKGSVQSPFMIIQEAYVPDKPDNGLMYNIKMSILAAIAAGFLACMAFGFAALFQQSARNQQQSA